MVDNIQIETIVKWKPHSNRDSSQLETAVQWCSDSGVSLLEQSNRDSNRDINQIETAIKWRQHSNRDSTQVETYLERPP